MIFFSFFPPPPSSSRLLWTVSTDLYTFKMSGVQYTNVEKSSNFFTALTPILTLVAIAGIFAGVGMLEQIQKDVDNLSPMHVPASIRSPMPGVNTCAGKKTEIEAHFAGALSNNDCDVNAIANGVEQAGGNVTVGYVGGLDVGADEPIKTPYYQQGLCPVNVQLALGRGTSFCR